MARREQHRRPGVNSTDHWRPPVRNFLEGFWWIFGDFWEDFGIQAMIRATKETPIGWIDGWMDGWTDFQIRKRDADVHLPRQVSSGIVKARPELDDI